MSDEYKAREVVGINEAMALVGVSRRTIYNWIVHEKVEYVRTAGGNPRIFVDSLWRHPNGKRLSRASTIGVQMNARANSESV